MNSLAGRPDRALTFLKQGIDEGRFGIDGVLLTAKQYARIGNRAETHRLLDMAGRIDETQESLVLVTRQFCDFLMRFPETSAEEMLEGLARRFQPATWRSAEEAATAALREKRGWLLMRLGDGEGSCLAINTEDAEQYKDLYTANRRQFLDIWFKDDAAGSKSAGFDRAISMFNSAIPSADCIGGVYQEAIRTEYRHCSSRGIPWIVNSMRKIACIDSVEPGWLDQVMVGGLTLHYDLLICGSFDRLIRSAERVGLISCHAELAGMLGRKYEIAEVEFIKVPGEQIHVDILGSAATEGTHWPHRFDVVCNLCSEGERGGQLFLVAAGLLGKIYAAKLKASGAVVIDIGAVADIWMRKATRDWFPGIPPEYMCD